jgi:hypothetical protein
MYILRSRGGTPVEGPGRGLLVVQGGRAQADNAGKRSVRDSCWISSGLSRHHGAPTHGDPKSAQYRLR